MKWLIYLALIILSFSVGYMAPKSSTQVVTEKEKETLLLPDMEIVEPRQLTITGQGENRRLRFSTTFVNKGSGPLEIFGHTDVENGVTYAAQYIYGKDSPGEYQQMGEFVFHKAHDHWHVADYVWYELWSVVNGQPGEKLKNTEKMSFCIWDEDPNDLSLLGAPQRRVYPRDCNGVRQGMSVGWSDTYLARIEGQEIDISSLADGDYFFKSGLNPDRKILESSYDNNENLIRIEIKGNMVTKK